MLLILTTIFFLTFNTTYCFENGEKMLGKPKVRIETVLTFNHLCKNKK